MFSNTLIKRADHFYYMLFIGGETENILNDWCKENIPYAHINKVSWAVLNDDEIEIFFDRYDVIYNFIFIEESEEMLFKLTWC